MNEKRNIATAICLLLFATAVCFANSRPGKKVSFNQNWRFQLGDVANGKDATLNDSQWRRLNLPHDWSIEGTFSEKLLRVLAAAHCPVASAGIARRLRATGEDRFDS